MLDFSVTFAITIVNIIFLCFILRVILFKPVTKFMADRANKVKNSIDQAERDKAEAKALLARFEAQMETAETEAKAIIQAARENAQEEAEKIIAESRASAEIALANNRKQLEMEHRAALAQFRKEAAALVVAASGRLLEREIQSDDNRHYAGLLLEEVELPGAGKI